MKAKYIFLNTLIMLSHTALLWADDDSHWGGSGAPMDENGFITGVIFFAVCGLILAAVVTAVHIAVFSSVFLLKLSAVLKYLTPVIWLLFFIAALPPVIVSVGLGYLSDGSYEYMLFQFVMLPVSFIYFYLINIILGLFSPKPFGMYMFRVYIALAAVGLVSLVKGLGILIFLLICVLTAWLAYKYYSKISERQCRKQATKE